MSSPASPTLAVSGNAQIARIRKVPPGATILVAEHDRVSAKDVVATAEVPGQMVSVDAAAILGVSKSRVLNYLKVKAGDRVNAGQLMGQRSALMGLVKTVLPSPIAGTIESVSRVSGHMMIRESSHPAKIQAFIGGEIAAVDQKAGVTVAAVGSLIQGVFGVGGEVTGVLCSDESDILADRIVCTFEPIELKALHRFREAGALGVIAPATNAAALMAFCGEPLNPAATGDENVGFTMVFTEGFGELLMAANTKRILTALVGCEVSMCGVTQIRAGVIRPELIGPPVMNVADAGPGPSGERRVKIIRGKYMGQEGTIEEEPPAPQPVSSGVSALVYRVKLFSSGDAVIVPRVNVE